MYTEYILSIYYTGYIQVTECYTGCRCIGDETVAVFSTLHLSAGFISQVSPQQPNMFMLKNAFIARDHFLHTLLVRPGLTTLMTTNAKSCTFFSVKFKQLG